MTNAKKPTEIIIVTYRFSILIVLSIFILILVSSYN